jgi:tetratricopeptide (TPR) repeat protein
LEEVLGRAGERSREYDWLGAIECYRRVSTQTSESAPSRKAETRELMGQAYFRAAMQAESVSDFRLRCADAVQCYEEARGSYAEPDSPITAGRILRCKSMISYLHYWLSFSVAERRNLIELSWKLTKESLETFSQAGDSGEFGRTYNQLSMVAGLNSVLQTRQQARETVAREAIEYGERAITFLSNYGDSGELAIAYAKTALFLGFLGQYFLDLDGRRRSNRKALRYWFKATRICQEAALSGLLSSTPDALPQFWGIGTEKALEYLKTGMKYARKTKDRFATGCALDWLAFNLYWRATICEDPEEKSRLLEEALKSAHDAKLQYLPISFTSCRGYSFSIEVADAVYKHEMSNLEVKISKRRTLIEQAERFAREGLNRCERAGYPLAILMGRHELSKMLLSLARVEQGSDKRKKLLEEALALRTEVVKGFERFLPFHYFDQGFMIGFLVTTKCELAEQTENAEAKRSLLEEAVTDKEKSVKLGIKYVSFYEKTGSVPLIADVCRWQLEYGDLLNRLYSLNKDKSCLQKQVKVLQNAAETYRQLDLMSRAAECFWRIAQTHQVLAEHLEAAGNFDAASACYGKVAEKMPQLEGFYQDKALYMHAWSEIERARHCHRGQKCGQARRHFERAAGMYRALGQWRYLAPNYSALATFEHAEDLSRKERCDQAIKTFEKAAMLFRETKKTIQKRLGKIENEDERQMAADVLQASDLRREYCSARVSVENARILDKRGEHYASAREYGSVVEIFERIAESSESEEDVKELRFAADLSKAWQKMVLAEERDMSPLYGESAQLFEKAGDQSSSDTARFLALGHSRFCRALEAGTRFMDTQEMSTYSTAMQCLQSATRYYKMAGLRNDVEHAKATELLFEAYAHVNNAKREVDPEKKARLYKMAEAILQASSVRYIKAKRAEKRDHVLGLLKTVQEEKEWALSCAQVLRTPPLVSASYFPAPTPTSERAVGLNAFEHADVQAYLSAPKEAVVGDEVNVRLDLINVAKSFGVLVRIDQLIPPGLKVIALDPNLTIEDGSLDLKGRKIEHMKIESVKIRAQVIQSGTITLNPRVVFVDDIGRFNASKPKAVRLTVNPRASFEFKVKSAEDVLAFLASSYFEDNERKMPLDRCGWRSPVDVMKNGKVPRSSLYKVGGGKGIAIAELERRGLIEARVFSGERGRGGNVLKLRICCDKEDIKRYVRQRRFFDKK